MIETRGDMRAFILERIRLMLSDTAGSCHRLFVERTQEMIDHPLRKRALKAAERRPASNERWPIQNRDCWYKDFDYNQLSDEDLILFYERLALYHWRQF